MWLKKLFKDWDVEVKEFTLFGDNISTIHRPTHRDPLSLYQIHFNKGSGQQILQHKRRTSIYDDQVYECKQI